MLDTHAGIGLYDLASEAALRTGESADGVKRALTAESLPVSFSPYLESVKHAAPLYPGSPTIAAHLKRAGDRLLLSELHEEDYATLKRTMRGGDNVFIHHQDAYLSMNALLPFKEKRGLILIDPPFEQKAEFVALIRALKEAYAKFPQGIYAIWYPIKDTVDIACFYDALKTLQSDKILISEFFVHTLDDTTSLKGCGMAIVNAPWRLDETLLADLPVLHAVLRKDDDAVCRTFWL